MKIRSSRVINSGDVPNDASVCQENAGVDVASSVSPSTVVGGANGRLGGVPRITRGNPEGKIIVLCDAPSAVTFRQGLPLGKESLQLVANLADKYGIPKKDFFFIGLCPPIPDDAVNSASRKWAHVLSHTENLQAEILDKNPKCVVTCGELASRTMLGRAVKITKSRGSAIEKDGTLILPMLSPGYVRRVPEHMPIFEADMATLSNLMRSDWKIEGLGKVETRYEWREDLSDVITMRPKMIAFDTETTGLRWYDPDVQVLTVQLTWEEGQAAVIAIDPDYGNWRHRMRQRAKLLSQLKIILEDREIKKCAHHGKFDILMSRKLGFELQGFQDDTLQMAFAVDENMMSKGLDDCIRRWVPVMSGYSDTFDNTVDKSRMREVPHEVMLPYAGGDTDAVFRLRNVLEKELLKDPEQYRCYRRIMIPGILAFANSIERFGMLIDQDKLREFSTEVSVWLEQEYRELIQLVPAKVRLKHLNEGKELKFSRAAFVIDVLFTKDGFNLKPTVFTDTTKDLPDDQKVPSTSTKDHLPYFIERDDAAGEFVIRLIEYQKTQKLFSTYIGHEENPLAAKADDRHASGMWQYISPLNGRIYPSYGLHNTATGRSASRNPNGQNFPVRGTWAKPYQKIFKATPGYKFVKCDLSQIELRLVAWASGDPEMLKVYREGGDIHTTTAKAVAHLTDTQWGALPHDGRKLLRYKAKACNFGYVFSMWWRKFKIYAKTQYGINYTDSEAKGTRETFFGKYRRLDPWHTKSKEFARKHGYIRALHGAVRHLPSIFSNDEAIQSMADRMAINSPIQRLGSDIGMMAIIRFCIQADPEYFRVIGFIHDAIVMEVKEGYEKHGIESLLWCMNNAPLEEWFGIRPPIPIIAEAEIGINGGETLEFADLPPVEERPKWFTDLGFDTVTPTKPDWWNDDLEEEYFQQFVVE